MAKVSAPYVWNWSLTSMSTCALAAQLASSACPVRTNCNTKAGKTPSASAVDRSRSNASSVTGWPSSDSRGFNRKRHNLTHKSEKLSSFQRRLIPKRRRLRACQLWVGAIATKKSRSKPSRPRYSSCSGVSNRLRAENSTPPSSLSSWHAPGDTPGKSEQNFRSEKN